MDNRLVLIVEDERQLSEVFRRFFEREGFRVVEAADGETALGLHLQLQPDLVVLDVKLPKKDGVQVLNEIRRRGGTPLIMSAALGQDLDKLTALRLGADDYIVKPFNPLELVARAQAVLRRFGESPALGLIRLGALEIDQTAHEARCACPDGEKIRLDLTPTEFRILAHMAQSPRRAFNRSEIVDACLSPSSDALDHTVNSHISNLRAKLGAAGMPDMLQSVRGIGYRLDGPA